MARFDALDDIEFEELTADLLRAATSLPFRSGGRGRDRGVDLLAETGGRRHEVQCKHFRTSSYSHLKAAARKEVEKLAARQPQLASYRFVTSFQLTHSRRAELLRILSSWADTPSDIADANDLERLLAEHPAVERRYVKLWLSGAGQLRRMLNARSFSRSRALLADIQESMKRYVQTRPFETARERLIRDQVLIICGGPGVGKTTLGHLLLIDSLADGYAPYDVVPGELADAWDLLADDDERQFFFFDDFLGQVTLASKRDPDRDLIRFIGEIRRRPTARLVIASREYVLQQALELSEVLDREAHVSKFLLEMKAYGSLERGRIFYNHLWFSPSVDEATRRQLVDRAAYRQIVDHPNYNPRLIEWITGFSAHRLTSGDKADYVRFCVSILDSPERLWRIAFESGIDDASRCLLFALALADRRAALADLETAFAGVAEAAGLDQRNRLFRRTLSVLDDSFLVSRPGEADEPVVSVVNPSLIDFIATYLKESPADAKVVADGIVFFDQALALADLAGDNNRRIPDLLLEPLSLALARTILREDRDLYWEDLDFRLGAVVDLVKRSSKFLSAVITWLADPARLWLATFNPFPHVREDDFERALYLMDLNLIDRAEVAEELYNCVRDRRPNLTYWCMVLWLRGALPETLAEMRWEEERERFERWLVQALGDPLSYIDPRDLVVHIYRAAPEADEEPWTLDDLGWDCPGTLGELAEL